VAPRQASEPAPAPRVAEQASVFAESVEIEGSLDGDGDVVLRGRVRGSISITGVLVVGETGRVQADVAAREVVNAGVVEGNIQARDRVRVQATGLVQGDIDSPSIVIDDGGGVEGFVAMQPSGGDEEEDDLPARPPAPAAGLLRKPASVQPGITPSPAAAPTPHPVPVRAQPPPPIAAAPVAPAPVAAPPVAAPPSHPVLGAAPQPPPAPAAARPPAAGLLFRPAQSPAALPSQPPPMSPDATVLVAPRPPSATPASGNGGNGGAGARDPFADEVATGAAGAREDGPLGGDPASNPL
jgi:cytoskeletal protein CcmA (bactofilin family)